jgi:ribosomal protein S18 acetylase RimI-like enzyme
MTKTPETSPWQLKLNADDETAYAVLARDRIWNGYAIADLVAPLRQYTEVSLARLPLSDIVATCVIVRHPAFTVIVCGGTAPASAEGLTVLFEQIDLPNKASIHFLPLHVTVVEDYYQQTMPPTELLRMATNAQSFTPPPGDWRPRVSRLTLKDLTALQTLYATNPEIVFHAGQLRDGIFYGVYEGKQLVAAGGTHAVTPNYRIAAVGGIYTLPQARGRGYGSWVTAAVVSDLLATGCEDVILNVIASNAIAERIYCRLGFRPERSYWEIQGILRNRA